MKKKKLPKDTVFVCRCGFKTNSMERMAEHIFTECGLDNINMKDEVARYNYYRSLVSFALEEVLPRIIKGSFSLKNCHPDEFRSIWVLLSLNLIKDNLFNVTPEDAQMLIARFAPSLFIAIMEYVGIVKVTIKNGKVYVEATGK